MAGSINVVLIDPSNGANSSARIDEKRALSVNQRRIETIPFSEYLTIDGTSTGSSQMAITTGTLNAPINFFIKASVTSDVLITKLKFFISGPSALLNEFGTGIALTNGCRLYYTDPSLGEIQLNPIIKSNYDLIRLADGQPAFGNGSAAYTISNAIGTSEAFHPVVRLSDTMPFGKGILLKKNSRQRIIIAIRDNTLTSRAVDFNCNAEGEQFL